MTPENTSDYNSGLSLAWLVGWLSYEKDWGRDIPAGYDAEEQADFVRGFEACKSEQAQS